MRNWGSITINQADERKSLQLNDKEFRRFIFPITGITYAAGVMFLVVSILPIFKDLAADADMQDISIDSTCIKAHKSSARCKKREILTSPKPTQKSMENARDSRKINTLGSLAAVEIPRRRKRQRQDV